MSDAVYGFPAFGPGSEVLLRVIDSVSLALIGTLVLEGGNVDLDPTQGVRIGQNTYFVATISEPGTPPINGQYIYAGSSAFVQTARSPNLGSDAIFGGIATDGTLIYSTAVPGFGSLAKVYTLDPTTLAILNSASFGPSPGSNLAVPTQPVYANGHIFVGLTIDSFPAQYFICVIDPVTLLATTITVASEVAFCMASPDGSTVYAAGTGSDVVYVIDTTSLLVIPETVSGALGFVGGTISPNGKVLWLSASSLIFVVDSTTFAIIQTVPTTGDNTGGLGMSSDGSTVFTSAIGQAFAINTVTYAKTLNVNDGVTNVLVVPGPKVKVPPPLRQKPRDDNLGLGAPRQRVGPGQPSSRQYSIRQGIAGTYS